MSSHTKQLGLRKNFGWALFGNLIYQGSQWLNLVILAKLMTSADVGRFALALAICTPITAFFALNLRAVQVTDTLNENRFGHFLALQLASSGLAMLVIAATALSWGDGASMVGLIVVVGAGQSIVLVREVFMAFNQKYERMDAVAVSRAMMGLGSLVALGLVVWATRNLLAGVAASQAVKLAVLLLWDLRSTGKLVPAYTGESARTYLRPVWQWRVLAALAWLALPLGLASVLESLFMRTPQYYVVGWLGEQQLGYFAAIMALVLAGKQIVKAAGLSALPRLSRYYLANRRAYVRLLVKLVLLGGALGVAGLVVVAAAGRPLLTIMFTAEYADYSNVFFWAMVYGMFDYAVSFLNFGMTATRRFKVQPIANLSALAIVVVAGWLMIGRYELVGAVGALMLGRLFFGLVTLTIILHGLRKPPVPKPGDGRDVVAMT